MAEVAGGSFVMGSDEDEGSAQERPQRRVRLSRYQIGVAPVTVSEFTRFLPRGYQDRAHWSEEGWAWRERERIGRPRFWGEDAWRSFLSPSQPVVGVSFWEAEAYARFAGARLPTEAEWEPAARGEVGWRYPWGDEWM